MKLGYERVNILWVRNWHSQCPVVTHQTWNACCSISMKCMMNLKLIRLLSVFQLMLSDALPMVLFPNFFQWWDISPGERAPTISSYHEMKSIQSWNGFCKTTFLSWDLDILKWVALAHITETTTSSLHKPFILSLGPCLSFTLWVEGDYSTDQLKALFPLLSQRYEYGEIGVGCARCLLIGPPIVFFMVGLYPSL